VSGALYYWYKRSTRAHANCIENLPVYGAIVFTASTVGASGWLLDALAVTVLCARVVQSTVHVSLVQTQRAVTARFSFYLVQVIAMMVMSVVIVRG
jgi:uncharacterized MAPEG superfamily protein